MVELANAALDNDASTEDFKIEAIQRVVDLYEAWHAAEPGKGYDAKADEWRAKLAEEGTKRQRDRGTEEEKPATPSATRPASAAPDDTDGSE